MIGRNQAEIRVVSEFRFGGAQRNTPTTRTIGEGDSGLCRPLEHDTLNLSLAQRGIEYKPRDLPLLVAGEHEIDLTFGGGEDVFVGGG